MRFVPKKKEEEKGNEVQTSQQVYYPQHQQMRSFGSTIALEFAKPWDVPVNLRDATTGFDASSTYLTDKEIKQLELKASMIEDLLFYLSFRPVDVDRMGENLIVNQMQRSLYAKVRLSKSRYGKLLDLAVKTIQEYRQHREDEQNGKGGFWRRF